MEKSSKNLSVFALAIALFLSMTSSTVDAMNQAPAAANMNLARAQPQVWGRLPQDIYDALDASAERYKNTLKKWGPELTDIERKEAHMKYKLAGHISDLREFLNNLDFTAYDHLVRGSVINASSDALREGNLKRDPNGLIDRYLLLRQRIDAVRTDYAEILEETVQ